jgi:hypothetical protein
LLQRIGERTVEGLAGRDRERDSLVVVLVDRFPAGTVLGLAATSQLMLVSA